MDIKSKVALVTGGAKRIGKVIALALAVKGANVAVNYLNSEKEALETVREIKALGVKAIAVKADVSDAVQVKRMFDKIMKEFGRVDIVVNNASLFYRTPFESMTEKDWDMNIDVNLKGPFLVAKEAAKRMKKGAIVNIADGDVYKPNRHYVAYTAAKGGVVALTRALAVELAPKIKVNYVLPGPTLLPEWLDAKRRKEIIRSMPGKKLCSVEDVVKAVVEAVESDETGMEIKIN